MIVSRQTLFKSGNILTSQMLQTLNENALMFETLAFEGYSDGIVTGCHVSSADDLIFVGRGIFRLHGATYMMKEPMHIGIRPTEEVSILSIVMGDQTRTENEVRQEAFLRIHPIDMNNAKDTNGENEIEIGRFKLQKGAKLRLEYRDFSDCSTEFDTLSQINAKWAAYQKESIALPVLEEFVKEASKYSLLDGMDFSFCQQINSLKGETLNRDYILTYLCKRLNEPVKEYSNKAIYEMLKKVLEEIKHEMSNKTRQSQARHRVFIS